AGRRVADDETNPFADVLRLSGITRAQEGNLKVRNRIYERVFDRAWVTQQMPDAEVRRQHAAYRRGLVRATFVYGTIALLLAVVAFFLSHERLMKEVTRTLTR